MKIKSLTVSDFRNYEREEIAFCDGTNVIFGNNAQGKTNILEAIYMFSYGRSHRTKSDTEMIRFGKDFAKLRLEFCTDGRELHAVFQILKNGKKSVKINNVPITKLSMLMRYLKVVMFSPEDLDIVKGSPQIRRRFLDESISQIYPTYLKNLIAYHKNLAQKNNLLKKLRMTGADDAMLDVWNEQIAEAGSLIMRYRKDFSEKLCAFSAEIHKEICGENFKLLYTPSIDCDIISKEVFYEKLQAVKMREIENGISLYGIQRDDLRFFTEDKEIKIYASQGQQRTAVLAMKLAQAEAVGELSGEYPVLLLDDIMSELDTNRREYLSGKIKGKQVIITCTDAETVKETYGARSFKAEGGKIYAEGGGI